MSYKINLRALEFNPQHNPLIEPRTVTVRSRYVRSGHTRDLVDPTTGEVHGVAAVHTVEERDDAEFVKVFAAGVQAAYGLSKTGARVFQAVLSEYQSAPMSGGYVDSIYLAFMDGGLCGRQLDMSEKTFQRGLKELLSTGFIAPKTPNVYWVNPALFFKGDRVAFIREYRRISKKTATDVHPDQMPLLPGAE